MSSRLLRDVALSAVEFLFLLLLWEVCVDKISWHEFAVGVVAALIGTAGDWLVKAEGFAPFRPHARWLALIFWEPWYVFKGSIAVSRELVRKLAGRPTDSRFRAVPYQFGGNTDVAAAKRALFAAYMTISPDTIVVGLDRGQQLALLHQLGTHDVPELGQRLGAKV
jgi:multisubunit Na+/H+ antiporter MnhE subunit